MKDTITVCSTPAIGRADTSAGTTSEVIMAASSDIEWTDTTWNPVRGCMKVSEGCRNCFAMGFAARFSGPGQPYEGLALRKNGKPAWTGEVRFVPEKLAEPLSWRKPRRIFVNSMSDLFHESLTNDQIAAVFGVMAACPQHTFQVLTKRPERMRGWFRWADLNRGTETSPEMFVQGCAHAILDDRFPLHPIKGTYKRYPWPLTNVWLGVSCENQETADARIPLLLQTPAAVRFVSAEPLLGPIDLWRHLVPVSACCAASLQGTDWCCDCDRFCRPTPTLGWVIVGGESGPRARPCAQEWIESIVRQCRNAQVACFVKQLGAVSVSEQRACATDEEGRAMGLTSRWAWSQGFAKSKKGCDPSEWPESLRVREWPAVDRK